MELTPEPPGPLKEELLDQFARIARAVASPPRLALLDLLAQGEKTVETLARQSDLSVTNASNHLQRLRSAALVSTRREGPYVHYRLADPRVHDFVRALQGLACDRLAEVRQIVRDGFESRDELEPVGALELIDRLRAGDVQVLDVRPKDEFEAGHIPGARSIPIDELDRRLAVLPADLEIVAYCRGPYCFYAPRAVELLRRRGFRARRMEEGLPDWRRRGLPVEVGAAEPDSHEEVAR